jgi:T-complex protein 1 subunit theta
LINKAQELLDYTKSEEDFAEKIVKKISEARIDLVVSGGSVSELMMHYLEKYKIMVVRITSKFELKRICKAIGATPLARLDAPTEVNKKIRKKIL